MKALDVNQQVICPRCEEMVHRMSSSCPYCQHDLALPYISEEFLQGAPRPHTAPTKITLMPQPAAYKNRGSRQDELQNNTEELLEPSSGFLRSLVPIICLLSGTFFFFFGLLIKLFHKDGFFTLRWSVESWPYFIFPAATLMIVGLWTLGSLSNAEPHE